MPLRYLTWSMPQLHIKKMLPWFKIFQIVNNTLDHNVTNGQWSFFGDYPIHINILIHVINLQIVILAKLFSFKSEKNLI